MALTAEFILQGYAYALEQCGVLLRDACRLYKEGSHAGAIMLTRSAQEALGQAHILLDMWRQASAGETFTTEQLREACKDHGAKQRRFMSIQHPRARGIDLLLPCPPPLHSRPCGSPETNIRYELMSGTLHLAAAQTRS